MPTYEWKCTDKTCDYTTSTEQSMSEDLVYPECPDHGTM